MGWTEEIATAARAHQVGGAIDALASYVELFVRWNQKINLSSARTPSDVAVHVVDCLALLPFVENGNNVIDVGSGGGLPGIVIAICRPIRLTSLEPIHKKAAFQTTVARALGLNIAVRPERVDPCLHVGFDVAMSRATFDLVAWLAIGRTLVSADGVVLAMEGREERILPNGATRHTYQHGDRTRAVIRYQEP